MAYSRLKLKLTDRAIYTPGRSGSKAFTVSIALLAMRGLGPDRVAQPTAGGWLLCATPLLRARHLGYVTATLLPGSPLDQPSLPQELR